MERSTFIVDRRGRHRSTVKVDRSIGNVVDSSINDECGGVSKSLA